VIEVHTLPTTMIRFLAPFAPLFSKRVWQNAQVLLAGAILPPGRRTVSSTLRAMGLDQHKRFHRYHRVLSRASWSSRQVSHILLGLLVEAFVGEGPLILGIDETLERRWGKKISAKGVYRDPVRSTHETYVKRLLAPALKPGRVVVMDNLGAHRPRRVRELIEARGCELVYLPSYSPDLNPIEEALSKIKHIIRKIGARTKEGLIEAMGRALAAVSAQDVRGFFVTCGYRAPAQQL
jgi:transposase